jgi:hypothetical protein
MKSKCDERKKDRGESAYHFHYLIFFVKKISLAQGYFEQAISNVRVSLHEKWKALPAIFVLADS